MSQKTPNLPPFLIIPGISSQFPKELRESLAELNEAHAAIEKARDAYDDLKQELKAKRAELEARREEISKTGGASAAAARMGLATPADPTEGRADSKRIAAQLESEIEDLQGAVDAAPEVFETARARLQFAQTELKERYGDFREPLIVWTHSAKRAMETANKQIDELISRSDLSERNSYGSAPEGQFAEGHPFALISGLLEFSVADTKASKSDRPLVAPPRPAPIRADDAPGFAQRFLEDPKEWRARREREERQREAADPKNH